MRTPFLLLSIAGLLAACAANPPPSPSAVAQLQPTKGNTAQGTVRFVRSGDVVRVTGEIRGLKPDAEHGFHIHEKGDCSSGDGMSTGGHYNPAAKAHGAHNAAEHHAGDLPSLKADATGTARLDFTSRTLGVGDGAADVVGRGLIVHRDADDFKTQPTGNAGPRVACAVIVRMG